MRISKFMALPLLAVFCTSLAGCTAGTDGTDDPSDGPAEDVAEATSNLGPAPGVVSAQLDLWGKCPTRTWYGNYGSVPVAQVWLYPGAPIACSHMRTSVAGMNGANVEWTVDPGGWMAGFDPWGQGVSVRQATGPGPAYGVGQRVCLDGVCYQYWFQ